MPSRERPNPPAGSRPPTRFIAPALATSISKVPSGARWIHEVKFDGYRAQVHIRDAAVTVFTRRGNDWTKQLKTIEDDACTAEWQAIHRPTLIAPSRADR
jgi:bifunctional non-homologous end joining protein LigD